MLAVGLCPSRQETLEADEEEGEAWLQWSGSKNGEVELNCPALWEMESETLKKHLVITMCLIFLIWKHGFGKCLEWSDYGVLRSLTKKGNEWCRERMIGSSFSKEGSKYNGKKVEFGVR